MLQTDKLMAASDKFQGNTGAPFSSQEAGLKLKDAIDAKSTLKIAIEERWG
jgi:hypothetical protein